MAERRGLSVRARVTAGAVAVLLVALAAGAAVLVTVLGNTLVASTTGNAVARLESLTRTVAAQDLSAIDDVRGAIAQLQDEDGEVLASASGTGAAPLPLTDGAIVRRGSQDWVVVSDDVLVTGTDEDDPLTLIVGLPVAEAERAVGTATLLLAIGVPLAVALIGVVTWWAVGRALRPVDRLRTEVEEIESSSLDRRLAVPATHDEIARLAVTMNGMLARLSSAQRQQRRFVSDASHELRSPLATMRQYAELEAAHPHTLGEGELSRVVLQEGVRMADLVDSLLLLARLDESAPTAGAEVDLAALVGEEADRLRGLGALDVGGTVEAVRVPGDPALLARALRNLVDNAARHAHGAVTISVRAVAGAAEVVVEDDGEGIAEADREVVFERFARADEGRARAQGGAGLGLAIVRAVAEGHGGTVRVEDGTTGGARLVLRLPTAR
jgi:signal transduction histidine kinase